MKELIEAINKNTHALGFWPSLKRGFAQAIGATLWLTVLSGPVLGILHGIGII